MRARDFITERKSLRFKEIEKADTPYTHKVATPGGLTNKGYYDLYRASMAVAGMDKDGNTEHMPDMGSWIAVDGYMGTYTEEEKQMAEKAFDRLGFKKSSEQKGPSQEPDAVNKQSPVKAFRGYPR